MCFRFRKSQQTALIIAFIGGSIHAIHSEQLINQFKVTQSYLVYRCMKLELTAYLPYGRLYDHYM